MNKIADKIVRELVEFSIIGEFKKIKGKWEIRYVWESHEASSSCPREGYKTFKEALKSLSKVKYK